MAECSKRALEVSEDELSGPPEAKKRISMSGGRKQTFLKDYTKKWPSLVESRKGAHLVHCTVCKVDFTCAHGGRNDCQRHVDSKSHQNLLKSCSGTMKITGMFQKHDDKTTLQRQITNSEVKLCKLIVNSNLSLSTADKLVDTMKSMFPDSSIARGMQCGRSKATAMIKEMSAMTMTNLAKQMKKHPFSLATDGSNEGAKKQFPLVIQVFQVSEDGRLQQVNSQLLAVRVCEGSATGENIFKLIEAELQAQSVPWSNCIAFGCDNAAVMTGRHKGVYSFICKEQPTVHLAGCSLHLVHIGAKKGASCLPPFEEILVDIFYFFKKSSLRQSQLKEFQQMHDVEQRKMLKYGCTRWLSISKCITRLLENWRPLRDFFIEEFKKLEEEKKKKGKKGIPQSEDKGEGDENPTPCSKQKLESIKDFLKSPTNRLYAMFLSYTNKVYDKVLLKLQAEEPLIHHLLPALIDLLRSLYSRFLKPAAVLGKEVPSVQFQLKCNQKDDKDLLIGDDARAFIADAKTHHLRESKIAEFYLAVRRYFEETCSYLLKKLPLNDPLLKHAAIADPKQQLTVTTSDLRYFLDRFPCLSMLPQKVNCEDILEEFAKFQVTDISQCMEDRVDHTWISVSKTFPELRNLCYVLLGICTIPHSSAACERIFSCVRKNVTDQRSSLHDDTLEAMLVLKTEPEDRIFTAEELDNIKSAYSRVQQQYK